MSALLDRVRRGGEAGFTLIELMVGMILASIVGAVLLSTVLSSQRSVSETRTTNSINEEARLTLNRLSRELREARQIDRVGFSPCGGAGQPACPAGVTGSVPTSITFEDDFNGDGVIGTGSGGSDPEVLTYCYDVPNKRILLTPHAPGVTDCADPDALPVLTSNVESFYVELRSSLYQYDTDNSSTTTWQELDAAPLSAGVGNQNGSLDPIELRNIDSAVINLTVFKGARRQEYRTQVALRNRP